MAVPFTPTEFFSVFERFNLAVGPAPLVAYAVAALALVLVCARAGRAADFVLGALLAASWAFTGAVYFLGFFRAIEPRVGVVAGALFVAQGALFAVATRRGLLRFVAMRTPGAWLGAALVLYATLAYPLLGAAAGHAYPRAPSFGVTPCPATIFTFGVLLFTSGAIPRWLLPIPLLWSFLGLSAAVNFGVAEDFALPVAGVLATAVLLARRYAATREERFATMPGDGLVPAPLASFTHGVDLPAPAARVWPWLAQMGAGRAGWYSYDRIDNAGVRSARRIVPEWQDPKAGDVLPAAPGATDAFVVAEIAPPTALALRVPGRDPRGPDAGSWAFLVRDLGDGRSRLVVRARLGPRMLWGRGPSENPQPRSPLDPLFRALPHLPDAVLVAVGGFGHRVMQVQQLRNLRRRVAHGAAPGAALGGAVRAAG